MKDEVISVRVEKLQKELFRNPNIVELTKRGFISLNQNEKEIR